MPWVKKFDNDEALAKAMHAFWVHGYGATSMQDLVDCMGINRGSLYATFGDKQSLFLKALRHYDQVHRRAWAEELRKKDSPRRAIEQTFECVIESVLRSGARDGCLLVNTALELSPHNAEVREVVRHGLAEMETFFHDMIVEGHSRGEIPTAVDPVETARTLLGLLVGLRVFSRSRPEADLLKSVARQAKALLQ